MYVFLKKIEKLSANYPRYPILFGALLFANPAIFIFGTLRVNVPPVCLKMLMGYSVVQFMINDYTVCSGISVPRYILRYTLHANFHSLFDSVATKKQTTKVSSANFKKM